MPQPRPKMFPTQILTRDMFAVANLVLNVLDAGTWTHCSTGHIACVISTITIMNVYILERLRIQTAEVGVTVRLHCGRAERLRRPVDWHCVRQSDTSRLQIIGAGQLTNGDFEGRLAISGSTLIIKDVQISDSGNYTCIKNSGQGTHHPIQLSVHGKLS